MNAELIELYSRELNEQSDTPVPMQVVETDIDLYHHMAFSLYCEIERLCDQRGKAVFIVPVGPVFQYRRFVQLCAMRPLRLDGLHLFFMDEYLSDDGALIDPRSPLSFRGFIQRELIQRMPEEMRLNPDQIHFPDPDNLDGYEQRLKHLGEADICYAGVGITGHLAFNDPPEPGEVVSERDFLSSPTRVVRLSRETVTINSNTALRGAMDMVPQQAVTVGFARIAAARKIRLYFNRPWQSGVVRRFLFGPRTVVFPVSLVRDHRDIQIVLTSEVARAPHLALQ